MKPEKKPQIIVQKYGGSTIGDPSLTSQILARIRSALSESYQVIVVVSALGRKGDPYATETLLHLLPSNPASICRREKDLLLACGEIISTVKLACELRNAGIPCRARAGFEAGIITDNEHGNARILHIDPRILQADLDIFQCVVVSGFQGISESGNITTLGRGGSDTSAVALGIAFNAVRVEIYTDTEGVFTADPHVVSTAFRLDAINAEDIQHMAWEGAKVLHPRAAELALNHSVSTLIGRVDKPAIRTHIHTGKRIETGRYITGVSCGPPVFQLTVFRKRNIEHADVNRVFRLIASAGISMDMFTLTEDILRFTIKTEQVQSACAILQREKIPFQSRGKFVKVSIIGAGMHGLSGVMSRFSDCLYRAGIKLYQTVDSHAVISGLVLEKYGALAQKSLHREFLESKIPRKNN